MANPEHGGHHEVPHAVHKAEKGGHDHGHEKKGGKESFRSMIGKHLRTIFSFTALFALSNMVSQDIAKPIVFETAKGAMETPARIVAQAASKAGESGGGHGSHGGGHGGGH